MSLAKPRLHVLRHHPLSLFDQLCIEEAILRSDSRNWLILNQGTPVPQIVLGLSGKIDKLVNVKKVLEHNNSKIQSVNDEIKLIRRFSGGGTVITNEDTLFFSFICSRFDIANSPQYPRELMKWSYDVYKPFFEHLIKQEVPFLENPDQTSFNLQENDYCIGLRKVGGNAQAISRDRFVHHTSFLWDFNKSHMDFLLLPEKRPDYRSNRSHGEFLTTIKASVRKAVKKEELPSLFTDYLQEHFQVVEATIDDAHEVLRRPQERQSNKFEML
jgi:lipoate-protein ligase A